MPKIEFRDDTDALYAEEIEVRGNGWLVAKITNVERNNHRVIPKDRVHQIIEDGDELTHTDV